MSVQKSLLALLTVFLLYSCNKTDDLNDPYDHKNSYDQSEKNTFKQDTKLLVDDLVLYTKNGIHKDPALIRSFVRRNFSSYESVYYYGQSEVNSHNLQASLILMENNRIKLNNKEMEIISKNDTLMLVAAIDSTDMPSNETEVLLGQCMKIFNRVPQYTPESICGSPTNTCKKYRETYPIIIAGKDYQLPILQYALVSNCNKTSELSIPQRINLFNNDVRTLLGSNDSLLVQISRLPMIK